LSAYQWVDHCSNVSIINNCKQKKFLDGDSLLAYIGISILPNIFYYTYIYIGMIDNRYIYILMLVFIFKKVEFLSY